MPRAFTFVHTADLHLGREFKGLLRQSASLTDTLHDAIYRTFCDLVDICIERKADFLVIAGDTFDGQSVSYRALSIFIGGMQKLEKAGIAVYLSCGNHDHRSIWSREITTLPRNVHVFPADRAGAFLHEDPRTGEPLALLVGRSWQVNRPTDDLSAGLTRAEGIRMVDQQRTAAGRAPLTHAETDGLLAIGVLHTGLSLNPEPFEIKPAALLHRGIDYWALGHIHQPPRAYLVPPLVYPGSPQGMQKKDEGMQGICLVNAGERQGAAVDARHSVDVERIPTSRVVWQLVELDVSTCETLLDVEALLDADEEFREAIGVHERRRCAFIVRLCLTGTSRVYDDLLDGARVGELLEALDAHYQGFHFVELIDHVHPALDRVTLRAEGLFPAVVLAQADELARDPSRLEEILVALSEADGLDYSFRECAPEELLAQATDYCLDKLVGSGGAR